MKNYLVCIELMTVRVPILLPNWTYDGVGIKYSWLESQYVFQKCAIYGMDTGPEVINPFVMLN